MSELDEQINELKTKLQALALAKRVELHKELISKRDALHIGDCYYSTLWPALTFYAVLTGISDDGYIVLSWFHVRDESVEMASDFHIAASDFFSVYRLGTPEEFEVVYQRATQLAERAIDSVLF